MFAAPVRARPELRHPGATDGHRRHVGRVQVLARLTHFLKRVLRVDVACRYPGVRSDSDMHTLGFKCVSEDVFPQTKSVTLWAGSSHGPPKKASPTGAGAHTPNSQANSFPHLLLKHNELSSRNRVGQPSRAPHRSRRPRRCCRLGFDHARLEPHPDHHP